MSVNNPEIITTSSFERREFIKRAAVGAGAVAVGMVALGCSSSSDSTAAISPETGLAAAVPSAAAWQFAVMADTQWLATDDGKNPNTCAVGLINQLNAAFIAQGVKFVVQVGDLADNSGASEPGSYTTNTSLGEDTRALFAQALYNNGIGFFVCRGNHDNGAAAEFVADFPQNQTGVMNNSPTTSPNVFAAFPNADTATLTAPVKTGSTFTQGSNFSSISSPSADLAGLSFGFDFNNARFVLIDQFLTSTNLDADGLTPYSLQTSAVKQQDWITSTLKNRPASSQHAFLFSHKGIITQQHVDALFGDCPSDANVTVGTTTYTVAPGAASAFIRSAANNGARLYFCGHDHNHTRSLVNTIDGLSPASLTHILCQSVSSKFYTPNEFNAAGNGLVPACTNNDTFFCGGKRQTLLSQELYRVGYYIVTVDGPNVSVDYFSAPAYPVYSAPTEQKISATPTLAFTKRETFGYGLNGQQFLVGNGASFTAVTDQGPLAKTVAKILSGTNNNPNGDPSGRQYTNAVNTGWYPEAATTASDILVLWGMGYTLGSQQTDEFTLSMSYDKTKGSSFVLATPDGNGNWIRAVDQNLGGAAKLVTGPWKSGYALGTYGIDTTAGTVWAVLNYNGSFAAVIGA